MPVAGLASSSECGGRGAPTTAPTRESLWALFQLGDIFTSTHVSAASQLEYIQLMPPRSQDNERGSAKPGTQEKTQDLRLKV